MRDLGIGKLRAELAELRSASITIGYQGDSGAATHPNAEGASVAEVAAWNEYGTVHAPARPALETAFARSSRFEPEIKRAMSDLIDGRRSSAAEAQAAIGAAAVAAVRASIDDSRSWADPLAPRTIRDKGHDQPWVESGVLRASASWAVRRNGVIVAQGGDE